MIIVSQDGETIVNFNNIVYIDIEKNTFEKYVISAYFDKEDSDFVWLGVYETKERAKEVLEEIAETYIGVRAIENCEADLNFNENTQMRIRPKMYYMPEV